MVLRALRALGVGTAARVCRAAAVLGAVGAGSAAVGASTPFERVFEADPVTASATKWDLIIVGGGFGGATLANALSAPQCLGSSTPPKPKRILLVERGGLMFPTHVLNTAGTVVHFHSKGSTQINDMLYQHIKGRYRTVLKKVPDAPALPDEYTGGPCYNLGGRGNLWGLYIPRVDDGIDGTGGTLREFFPTSVRDELLGRYYRQAECLVKNRPYKESDGGEPLNGDPYKH